MIRKIKREKLHYMCDKKIDKLQQYLFIQMKILFVILLIYLCRNQIIWQSNTSVVINGAGQAVQNTHPYNRKISQAPDAIWIWSKGWNGPTCVNPITIQQEISMQSNNPMTVYITADNNFTLQINGTQFLRGDNWQQIYSKQFSLKCGDKHNIKITAYNTQGDCSSGNPAGLIYAFLQDGSSNKCPKPQPQPQPQPQKPQPQKPEPQPQKPQPQPSKPLPQNNGSLIVIFPIKPPTPKPKPIQIIDFFPIVPPYKPINPIVVPPNNPIVIPPTKPIVTKSIIYQSNTQAVINGAGQAVPNTSPYNKKIPEAPDAIWIWSKGWNGPTCVNPITIQQEIFIESNNPITAYMTADNSFTLQINGNYILNGDDFTKIYSKEFSLKCGQKHKFKITAKNTPGDCAPYNPAGLIYAFSQNISSNRCPKVQSIVFQSTTDTVIRGAGRAVENTLPYNKKIPQAPNAKWIWSKGWNGPSCVNPIIVQQEFNVESKNPITVYITADNNFTLHFDGSQILRGNDQLKIYSKEFSPKCGQKHKFKIVAYNNYGDCAPYNPAGLVYAFLQDITSNRCPPLPVYIHSRTTKSHNAPSNHLSKHIHQFNHS